MTHPETRGLLAPFALDALERDEERLVEAHLADCEECRRELAQLLEAGAALAAGLPFAAPPPALRDAVLGSVRPAPTRRRASAVGPAVAALAVLAAAVALLAWRLFLFVPAELGPVGRLAALLLGAVVLGVVLALAMRLFQFATAASGGAPRTAAGARAAPLWLAAGAVVVALVGAQVFLAQRQNAALSDNLDRQRRLLALLTGPSSVTVPLTGSASGSVRLVVNANARTGALISNGLDAPKPGSVYQLWLLGGPKPESGAVFVVGPRGTTITVLGADFARFNAVAITVEPAPNGSPQPTTTPIWTGKLSGGKG